MKKYSPRHIDMTGQRFGRLTFISFEGRNRSGSGSIWKVRCDCGTEFLADRSNIVSGKTRSCGCYKVEMLKARHQ